MIYEIMGEAIAGFLSEMFDSWGDRRQRKKRRNK